MERKRGNRREAGGNEEGEEEQEEGNRGGGGGVHGGRGVGGGGDEEPNLVPESLALSIEAPTARAAVFGQATAGSRARSLGTSSTLLTGDGVAQAETNVPPGNGEQIRIGTRNWQKRTTAVTVLPTGDLGEDPKM
ncbi:hypothetical protein PoB_002381300 [Plakobranchus ocellatus]|uniref:Uncharacterized protein n=1 Tax=Plakobranchus ocellatus TaxID=259542 RepID=A0AAV3ZR42_9GAST|nr:hypothetical protein PoB_002381300 [Plakobranchus ocellatus]